jgi:hypothetical protein
MPIDYESLPTSQSLLVKHPTWKLSERHKEANIEQCPRSTRRTLLPYEEHVLR